MDVDDDDEYMNAAAAHAAFVMTVSAASMHWLVRHAQHARDINIHKLHTHFPKNSAWALSIFCTVEHPFSRLFGHAKWIQWRSTRPESDHVHRSYYSL